MRNEVEVEVKVEGREERGQQTIRRRSKKEQYLQLVLLALREEPRHPIALVSLSLAGLRLACEIGHQQVVRASTGLLLLAGRGDLGSATQYVRLGGGMSLTVSRVLRQGMGDGRGICMTEV